MSAPPVASPVRKSPPAAKPPQQQPLRPAPAVQEQPRSSPPPSSHQIPPPQPIREQPVRLQQGRSLFLQLPQDLIGLVLHHLPRRETSFVLRGGRLLQALADRPQNYRLYAHPPFDQRFDWVAYLRWIDAARPLLLTPLQLVQLSSSPTLRHTADVALFIDFREVHPAVEQPNVTQADLHAAVRRFTNVRSLTITVSEMIVTAWKNGAPAAGHLLKNLPALLEIIFEAWSPRLQSLSLRFPNDATEQLFQPLLLQLRRGRSFLQHVVLRGRCPAYLAVMKAIRFGHDQGVAEEGNQSSSNSSSSPSLGQNGLLITNFRDNQLPSTALHPLYPPRWLCAARSAIDPVEPAGETCLYMTQRHLPIEHREWQELLMGPQPEAPEPELNLGGEQLLPALPQPVAQPPSTEPSPHAHTAESFSVARGQLQFAYDSLAERATQRMTFGLESGGSSPAAAADLAPVPSRSHEMIRGQLREISLHSHSTSGLSRTMALLELSPPGALSRVEHARFTFDDVGGQHVNGYWRMLSDTFVRKMVKHLPSLVHLRIEGVALAFGVLPLFSHLKTLSLQVCFPPWYAGAESENRSLALASTYVRLIAQGMRQLEEFEFLGDYFSMDRTTSVLLPLVHSSRTLRHVRLAYPTVLLLTPSSVGELIGRGKSSMLVSCLRRVHLIWREIQPEHEVPYVQASEIARLHPTVRVMPEYERPFPSLISPLLEPADRMKFEALVTAYAERHVKRPPAKDPGGSSSSAPAQKPTSFISSFFRNAASAVERAAVKAAFGMVEVLSPASGPPDPSQSPLLVRDRREWDSVQVEIVRMARSELTNVKRTPAAARTSSASSAPGGARVETRAIEIVLVTNGSEVKPSDAVRRLE